MSDTADTIAGFGFCTDEVRPDLSDLDDQLARIEASGASHCELSLYELDLIVGGRVLPERRRLLERICARRALKYTVHGVLTVNFMDEVHLDLHKAVCRAMLELCDAVGASVMAHHPGRLPATHAAHLERLHGLERDALREMGDVAAGYGVRIAVENLFVEDASDLHPRPGASGQRDRRDRPSARVRPARLQPRLHHGAVPRHGLPRDARGVRARGQSPARARFARSPDQRSAASIASPSRSRSAWAICTCRWAGATSRGTPSCPGCGCGPA